MSKFTPEMESLDQRLHKLTKEGVLYKKHNGKLQCYACAHRCVIGEGKRGICQVRYNEDGVLRVPTGYVAGLQVDPIEKKPFFHALPGCDALSFGMLGCDYHCGYCQNWITSQALRESAALVAPKEVSAKHLVELAVREDAKAVVSTYNEPLITSEWAMEVFAEAKKKGLHTAYVSNGNATPEVLDYIRPLTDYYKIDLKSFDDKHYRSLGGVLDHVLESIQNVYDKGFWIEIVTLIVPGFNDATDELKKIAQFLAGVSSDIPWHVTAFHHDFKMQDSKDTQVDKLIEAYDIGKEAGLHFVYCGNRPGQVGDRENTYCPDCQELLIERFSFHVNKITIDEGRCPKCSKQIPGQWELPKRLNGEHGIPRVISV